ncbi:hypothetical protein R3W88_024686 [Solanum pinnatisectum]|uniref:Reverse transcriptase zinc-binding domain-containing protein n=1 Tax=Solanum pinnatisectum TaxID=50273 RepID=A0AAV9M1S2_9SOLN|nr:hypothetical protein R3W88_024686 [Solanum pinnatisectum]
MEETCMVKLWSTQVDLYTMYRIPITLSTKDKMAKWGITNVLTYPMCQLEDEDIDHLFFECSFMAGIWNKLLAWQGIHRTGLDWKGEIQWAIKHITSRNSTPQVYMMTLVGTIYNLWWERNYRIFQNKQRNEEFMTRLITREINNRGSQQRKLISRLQELNVYP